MQKTKQKTLTLGIATLAAFSFCAIEAMSLNDMKKAKIGQKRTNTFHIRNVLKKTKNRESSRDYQFPNLEAEPSQPDAFESAYFKTNEEREGLLNSCRALKHFQPDTKKINKLKRGKLAANIFSFSAPAGLLTKGTYNILKKSSADGIKPKDLINPWTILGVGFGLGFIGHHLWIRPQINENIDSLESPENALTQKILKLKQKKSATQGGKIQDEVKLGLLLEDDIFKGNRFPGLKLAIESTISTLKEEEEESDDEESDDGDEEDEVEEDD